MSTAQALSADDPRMIAWNKYKETEAYKNSFMWAEHEKHRDGSMWAAFIIGYEAARHAPAPEADEDDKFDKIFASLELRTHKLLDQYGVPKNSKGFPDVYDGLHCRLEQHFQSAPAPEWEQDTDPNPELPPNPPVITIAGGKESDGSEQKKSGTDHAPGHFAYWVSGPIWVIVLFVLLYFAWRPLMRHGKIWFVESSTSAGELHQFCSKRVRVTFDAPGAKVGDFAVFSRTSAGTLHDIGRMPLENEPNYEIASVNGTQGEICSMIWN